jgi:hypothetical protein
MKQAAAYAEVWGILLVYCALVGAAVRVATRKSRPALNWVVYSVIAPGISLIDALLLDRQRNDHNRRPAQSVEGKD